jgi:hypothetical protein
MEITQSEFRILYGECREELCTEDCLALGGWRGQLHPSTARKIRLRNQKYLNGEPDDSHTRVLVQYLIFDRFPELILLPY